MCADPVGSSASVVIDAEYKAEDDQEGAPVKKKCLWDSFDKERNLHNYQSVKTKRA